MTPRLQRLKRATSCSALAGLVLLGEYVHRLRAEVEAEIAAGPKKTGHPRPPRHSRGAQVIPWIISCLSVAALMIVVLATK